MSQSVFFGVRKLIFIPGSKRILKLGLSKPFEKTTYEIDSFIDFI